MIETLRKGLECANIPTALVELHNSSRCTSSIVYTQLKQQVPTAYDGPKSPSDFFGVPCIIKEG